MEGAERVVDATTPAFLSRAMAAIYPGTGTVETLLEVRGGRTEEELDIPSGEWSIDPRIRW
jgi:hypothetical protein